VEVLLVDLANFSLFSPMLPEVATGDIETRHILIPHRDVLPPRSTRQGRVLSFDWAGKIARVETSVMPRLDAIRFDHVLFAPGGVTNFFGVPGAEEHAFTFKTIGDAVLLRNRVLALLERASVETSAEGRERLCRVVIVRRGILRGGAGGLARRLFRRARRQYPELRKYLGVSVVEMQEEVTPTLPASLREEVRRRLHHAGVDLRLGCAVKR
jgi:NADH dehydrogenase